MFAAISGRSRLTLLAGVFSLAVVVVTGAALLILYEPAFDEQRARLTDIVQSRARLMEANSLWPNVSRIRLSLC